MEFINVYRQCVQECRHSRTGSRLRDSSLTSLVDPKIVLDHVNFPKSVMQVRRAYKRFQRGKAHFPNNHTKSKKWKSDSNTYATPTKSNNNNFPKKDVHQDRTFRTRQIPRELPVPGRLSLLQNTWNKIIDEEWVLYVLSKGFKMPFTNLPALSSRQKAHSNRVPLFTEQELIKKEILSLLCKKAIEEISNDWVGFRCRLFTIHKKTEEHRPVLNLRPLNQSISHRHFKMKSLKTACTIKSIKMTTDQHRFSGCFSKCARSSIYSSSLAVRNRRQAVPV